jgi:hypothetical protein
MTVLWFLLFVAVVAALSHWILSLSSGTTEGFTTVGNMSNLLDMEKTSTRALDAAPTTSEVKKHYKNLLIFADADIKKDGSEAFRILGDLRTRLFGNRNFRANLSSTDILADWPKWLPPLDPTMKEPIPTAGDAETAEIRILAYLQKNFPQESEVDEETGSTLRNLVEDFGRRFIFGAGEPVQLREDFLRESVFKGWVSPLGRDV